MASPGAMLPPEFDLNTVRQPPPTRAPSYRQAYQGYRNGEDVGGRGAVHAIRAATYMSGGLATPHGSAAQFKRVSSVNLLATSLEHATELYDELERLDSQLKISGLLSGCVGVAATANFLNGYHTSVMNSAEASALPGHSLVAWSVAVAALPLAGAPGSFIGGWLAEGRRLGRDGCLWFVGFVYLIGGAAMVASIHYGSMKLLIAARLLVGLACGATTVVLPVYLGELAPPRLRGTFGTFTQLAMVIGILAADLVALVYESFTLFLVSFLTAAVMLICAGLLPLAPTPQSALAEDARIARMSPGGMDPSDGGRWLGAVELCKNLYLLDDEAAREEAHAIATAVEARQTGENPAKPNFTPQKRTLGGFGSPGAELLEDEDAQKRAHTKLMRCALVLHVAQQLSGINAVFYYSTTFLQGVIDSPAVGTALVGFINVLATMFASALMDSHRRRSMLILSIVGMLAGALVLTLALNGSLGNAWALAGVGSYVFFFELGLGPIPWMIVPELFTADKVVQSQSAGSQINWTMNVVVGLGFPALNAALGAYAFVPFALVLVATLLFVLVALPETYGRTPEDVFRDLVIRESGGYYAQGYGAVSTLELARAQTNVARSRSRLKLAGL
jgi:SP family facilitated glucose transporter-like MFS transporter 3